MDIKLEKYFSNLFLEFNKLFDVIQTLINYIDFV